MARFTPTSFTNWGLIMSWELPDMKTSVLDEWSIQGKPACHHNFSTCRVEGQDPTRA
jgi:hypothetical protein